MMERKRFPESTCRLSHAVLTEEPSCRFPEYDYGLSYSGFSHLSILPFVGVRNRTTVGLASCGRLQYVSMAFFCNRKAVLIPVNPSLKQPLESLVSNTTSLCHTVPGYETHSY